MVATIFSSHLCRPRPRPTNHSAQGLDANDADHHCRCWGKKRAIHTERFPWQPTATPLLQITVAAGTMAHGAANGVTEPCGLMRVSGPKMFNRLNYCNKYWKKETLKINIFPTDKDIIKKKFLNVLLFPHNATRPTHTGYALHTCSQTREPPTAYRPRNDLCENNPNTSNHQSSMMQSSCRCSNMRITLKP